MQVCTDGNLINDYMNFLFKMRNLSFRNICEIFFQSKDLVWKIVALMAQNAKILLFIPLTFAGENLKSN